MWKSWDNLLELVLSITWIPRIKFRSSGLTANAVTGWAIWLALFRFLSDLFVLRVLRTCVCTMPEWKPRTALKVFLPPCGMGAQTRIIWSVHKGTYFLSQPAGLWLFFSSWVSWYNCRRSSQANPSRSCHNFSIFATFGKLQTLFELISSPPKLGNNPTCAIGLL